MAVSPIMQMDFCVKSFGVSSLLLGMVFLMYFRICSTSHTKEYLGTGGLSFEMPLSSAFTLECWPTGRPSIGSCRADMADL